MAARCSFCGRGSADDTLVTGPRGVAICGDCADVALAVVEETSRADAVDRVITGIGLLVTQDERLGEERWGLIAEAGLVIRLGRVTWVGPQSSLPARYRELPRLDAGGRMVIPGFVDPITRLLGGPPADVADAEARVDAAVELGGRMMQHGVTALGLRVGGSSEPTTETLALAAARTVGERLPASVSVAWVDGGTIPEDLLSRVMVPTASRLASSVEHSCIGEEGHEGLAGRIARYTPMRPHIRLCDEPGDCLDLAAGALTVEGWAQTDPVDATTAVLEPLRLLDGAPLPIRKLMEAGGQVAIASGSSPEMRAVSSPVLPMTLAVDVGGVDVWQALWAATRGAAIALGDAERGRLRPGDPADLVVLDAARPEEILRRPDANPAWRVVCGGAIVPM